ncbi:MAG: hypothetical protein NVS4B11_22200 [Ktedonobacteraceae bacterium]
MQDRQVSINGNNEQTLSLRSQRLVELIEEAWQDLHEPTAETMKRLVESLPEPYRSMSMGAIGERLVNNVKLHYLDIIAEFVQKAEQEGISTEEQSETLQDARLSAYRLMELSKYVSVQSLSDLLQLSTITSGLRALSKVEDAESAQNWIYKLPSLYQGRLKQEHLTEEKVNITFSFSTESDGPNTWHSSTVSMTAGGKARNTQAQQFDVQSNWTKLLPKSVHTYSTTLGVSLADAG